MNNPSNSIPTLKKSAAMMLQSVAAGALGILFWLYLARMMSVSDFGELSAAQSVLGISVMIAALGMGTLVTKEYSKSFSVGTWELSRGLRKTAPLLIFGACVICFVILVGCHSLIHEQTAVRLESFVAVIALLPLYALVGFFGSTSSAFGAPGKSKAITGWFAKLIALAVLLAFGVAFNGHIGILGAAGIFAISTGITLFAILALTKTIEPDEIKRGDTVYSYQAWIKSGLAIALAGLTSEVLDKGGMVILGWVHADSEATARLSVAVRLSFVLLLIGAGLTGLYKPLLARAVGAGDFQEAIQLLKHWLKTIIVPIVAVCCVLIIFGKFFLSLFGDEYRAGYWTLVVYAINNSVGAVIYIGTPLYQYLGCSKQVLIIMVIATIVGIVGMVVLGNLWSDFGVALATTIATEGAFGCIFLLCLKKMKQLA